MSACALASPFQTDFAFSQTQFENVGDAESISEGVVTALAQDARGFIWIGTQVGLVRYDGYNFRKFSHGASDPFSLAGDHVASLMVARDGRLWVGTNSAGLSVFDPGSERFENFAHDAKRPDSLSGGRISAIAEDAKGAWLATDRGLDYLPRNGRDFRHYRHDAANPASLLNNKVRSLLQDRAGRLWVGGLGGLQRLSENGKDFEPIAGDGFTDKSIQTLFQAQDGKLWVGTEQHGAAWLEGGAVSADALKPHWLELDPASGGAGALGHAWVNGIVQMQADQIWLATYGGGINIVAASDGRVLQQLHHDPGLRNSLALDAVQPMLLDRAGLLWVGTWGGGLQRFNQKNNMVRLLRHNASLPRGLSSRNVHSVLELANGQILFGTDDNGIDIFDRTRGLVGGYRATKGQAGALPDAAIHALAQTADGSLWAGTRQAGLLRLPQGGQAWQPVSGLPDRRVRKILESRDGDLWVATSLGVARLKKGRPGPLGGKAPMARFEAVPDEHGKPMQSVVHALAEDGQGRIWAGTDNGLWVLAPGTKGWHGINKDAETVTGPFSDLIFGLLIDGRDRLWLATDQGLFRLRHWDGKTAQFEHISAQMGQTGKALGDNLLEDKAGRIWAESALIDPATMQMVPLTKADGFDYGSNWTGAHYKTRDGLLLFGGTQGVAVIDPALFRPWTYMPPVVITELKINGQAVPLGASALLPEAAQPGLTLNREQRDFALEFAALDLSEPKQNRYRYRLQGYDKDWIEADFKHRSVAYGNLWPGDYQLQVHGSNRLGQWSTHALTIPVRVLPAFWQTGWFWLLMALALGCTVYAGYRWRLTYLRAKARVLQRLIEARTADIHKLSEIGQELAATLDTEQAFARVQRQVSARLDADVFLIGIVDPEQTVIEFVYKIEHRQRLPNSILSMDDIQRPAVWCVRNQSELIVNKRSELLNYIDAILPPSAGKPMETIVYMPLLSEQRVIGCLSVQSPRQHAYGKDQLEFLRVLASYSAIALSNSLAHSDLAQSHLELTTTLEYLKETQAKLIQAERQQISLDLHDNLSQTMTGILLQLDTARDVLINDTPSGIADAKSPGLPYVDRAIELARDGIAQTRQLLRQLRTKKFKQAPIDLIDALRRDLPRLTMGTPIKVDVEQHGHPVALESALELAFFRIAQEAVTNALRHSKAKTIRVLLAHETDGVVLSVSDDGCGFDPALPANALGIGLAGMQERIAALAGTLHIQSSPGTGTCVSATMPMSLVRNMRRGASHEP